MSPQLTEDIVTRWPYSQQQQKAARLRSFPLAWLARAIALPGLWGLEVEGAPAREAGLAHQGPHVLSRPCMGDGAGGVQPWLAAVGLVASCLGPGGQTFLGFFVSCVLTTARW